MKCSVLLLCGLSVFSATARPVIEWGPASEWRYWTGDKAEPAGWQNAEFDDKAWTTGAAPLGLAEKRLTTSVKPAASGGPPALALFRKSFTLPKLEAGARTVVSLCVDDGARVFINGRECQRLNLPAGELKPETKALRQLSDDEEGAYVRWTVPAELLKPNAANVIAVEVRQAARDSGDLFFDLALRTIAPRWENPKPTAATQEVITAYYKGQYVPPGLTIPDGYLDGGRKMTFDEKGRAVSNREIIMVDRTRDEELKKHLAFAHSETLQQLTPRERAVRLAVYVDKIATPPGGDRWTEVENTQLTQEFTNQPVLMGEILEQCQAGVCRHRALLFKILADAAGLKTALRRGNLFNAEYATGYPHAWNEVHLEDGTRLLVDTSYRAGKWDFPSVTTPFVVAEYRKLDNSPIYDQEAEKKP